MTVLPPKLSLDIFANNLYKYRKPERSSQKPSRISCQSVLIPRKISGTFYAEFREKYMEFEETNEEFEGKMTRNLKEKHREFFTRESIIRNKIFLFFLNK